MSSALTSMPILYRLYPHYKQDALHVYAGVGAGHLVEGYDAGQLCSVAFSHKNSNLKVLSGREFAKCHRIVLAKFNVYFKPAVIFDVGLLVNLIGPINQSGNLKSSVDRL